MNTKITEIGAALLAIGLCVGSTQAYAQATTRTVTVFVSKGAFAEYVPGSETVLVKGETNAAPLRYVITKQTTVADESGAPLTLERIPAGSPLSIQYTGTGDRLVASQIIVQKPMTTQETTTTTTRPLTRHEKHELKEQKEHPEREARKAAEREKKTEERDEH